MGSFSRSWEITKLSFEVMKKDKELFLFPILGGIFSIIFFIAMVFPAVISPMLADESPQIYGPIVYLWIFLIYLGLAMIATFFNVCVVYTVKTRFDGKNATFGESIKFALSKLHLIFLWGLVSATVGLILRALDELGERMGAVGELIMSIVVSLLGAAWSIITIFVVPAMVYNNLTPFAAIKKSAETLKKTWGESLIRYYALGIIQFIFIILGIAAAIFAFIFILPFNIVFGLLLIGLAGIYLIAVITIFSVLNQVFNTALYCYAEKGVIPAGFSEETLKHAFERKKRNEGMI